MANILITGYKRSGKDSLAEIWAEEFGATYQSSSWAAAQIFIYDALKHKYGYQNIDECFADRVNRRAEWFDMIEEYNREDPTRLAREIMADNDIYCGMRSRKEIDACLAGNVFDIVIWVDAEERVGKEDSSSCKVTKADADIIIQNNEDYQSFREKAVRLGRLLFRGKN